MNINDYDIMLNYASDVPETEYPQVSDATLESREVTSAGSESVQCSETVESPDVQVSTERQAMIDNITRSFESDSEGVGIFTIPASSDDVRPPSYDTAKLYDTLLLSGLNAVVAASGKCKTNILLTLAEHASSTGKKVLYLDSEMGVDRLHARLLSIATGVLPEDLASVPTVKLRRILERLKATVTLCTLRLDATVTQVADILWPAVQAYDLVCLDGLDAIAKGQQESYIELLNAAAEQAKNSGKCIWTTSQITRAGDQAEVLSATNVAFAMEKVHFATTVLAIGVRQAEPRLLTALVVKDRHGKFGKTGHMGHGQPCAFRLAFDGGLRLVLDHSVDELIFNKRHEEPTYLLWAPEDGDDAECPVKQPDLAEVPAYAGYVPLNRTFFQRPMYANRRQDYVYYTMVLAAHARFKDGVLYAPKTHIPVTVGRGQYMTSTRQLADLFGTTKAKVEGYLTAAVREGVITIADISVDGSLAVRASNPTSDQPSKRSYGIVVTINDYWANSRTNVFQNAEESANDSASISADDTPTVSQRPANDTPVHNKGKEGLEG